MRITIVAMELPYPPIHGGRVDIWRRIKALHKAGVSLQLVAWSYSLPNSEDTAVINNYVDDFYPLLYKRSLGSKIRRVFDLLSYPLEVTSRIVRNQDEENLIAAVKKFSPDVIFADHVHAGLTANRLSQVLEVPFIVRSHDIEHLHYQYWFKSATGLKKLQRLLSLSNLEQYEKSIFKQALGFYDISVDDLQFWEEEGMTNGHWLPPLIELSNEELTDHPSSNHLIYDVVFLGNLVADNNVAGVIWFLKQVVPILESKKPDVKILIAGSNPVNQIIKLCEESKCVELKSNPPSATEIYRSGRVFINPVAVGSGVSIKSIDMLAIGRPIVTMPKGLFGLPEEAKKFFRVASDAQSFADEILRCLAEDEVRVPDHALLASFFGQPVIDKFVADLSSELNQHKQLSGVGR